MNPLDLAKKAAGESGTPLEEVSLVYAELAAIAEGIQPIQPLPPEFAFSQEELLHAQAELQEMRDRAQEYRSIALAVAEDNAVTKSTKVKVLTTVGAIDHDPEVIEEAKAIAEEIRPGVFGPTPERADAYIQVALVERSKLTLEYAINALMPLDNQTQIGIGVPQRMEILTLVADLFGKGRALSFADSLPWFDRARALNILATHLQDQEIRLVAYASTAVYSPQDFAPELACLYATLYSVDRDPASRAAALERIDQAGERKPDIWREIASADLSEDTIDSFGSSVEEQHAWDVAKLDAYRKQVVELYARAGLADRASEQLQTISDMIVRNAALESAFRIYCEQGDIPSAVVLMRSMPLDAVKRMTAYYVPALIRVGNLSSASEEAKLALAPPLNYEAAANIALAYTQRAQQLEEKIASGGAIS